MRPVRDMGTGTEEKEGTEGETVEGAARMMGAMRITKTTKMMIMMNTMNMMSMMNTMTAKDMKDITGMGTVRN